MTLANRTAGFRRLISENLGVRGSKVAVVALTSCLKQHSEGQSGIRDFAADLSLLIYICNSFSCTQNLAAWAVAGTAAYILWVKPDKAEQQKRVG